MCLWQEQHHDVIDGRSGGRMRLFAEQGPVSKIVAFLINIHHVVASVTIALKQFYFAFSQDVKSFRICILLKKILAFFIFFSCYVLQDVFFFCFGKQLQEGGSLEQVFADVNLHISVMLKITNLQKIDLYQFLIAVRNGNLKEIFMVKEGGPQPVIALRILSRALLRLNNSKFSARLSDEQYHTASVVRDAVTE